VQQSPQLPLCFPPPRKGLDLCGSASCPPQVGGSKHIASRQTRPAVVGEGRKVWTGAAARYAQTLQVRSHYPCILMIPDPASMAFLRRRASRDPAPTRSMLQDRLRCYRHRLRISVCHHHHRGPGSRGLYASVPFLCKTLHPWPSRGVARKSLANILIIGAMLRESREWSEGAWLTHSYP
jgi:hypothetical protein